MDSEKKQEYTRRVSRANSTEMVVIIYDILLDYVTEAVECREPGGSDRIVFETAISKIQSCLNELKNSLDMRYEPAPALMALYGFCQRRIGVCQAKNDPEILSEITKIIKPLRDAFDSIKDKNKNGPVMGNSQTVYAGLTYGKDELMESLSTPANRGYLV